MVVYIIAIVVSLLLALVIINVVGIVIRRRKSVMYIKKSLDMANLPIITFKNGDDDINFLLDTGSDVSYIDKTSLENYDYEETDITTVFYGMEGAETFGEHCFMTVSFKEYIFNLEFSIADLKSIFDIVEKSSGIRIHGILGSNFLKEYKYVLDFKDLKVYIK